MSNFDFENYDELPGYVNLLIERYEREMLEGIAKATNNTDYPDVAWMIQRPFSSAEGIAQLNFDTLDLISNSATADEAPSEKEEDAETPEKKTALEEMFYWECSYDSKDIDFFSNFEVGETERVNPKGYVWKKGITKSPVKIKYGQKVTSYLDELLDQKMGGDGKFPIGDKDFNFGIEKCFNCRINSENYAVLPKLELLFDIEKFINDIKNAIKQLKQEFDPTAIMNAICSLGMGFGENLFCPALLSGMNIALPALFVQYTFDLIKFRFDWTAVLGPIIKGVLDFINQLISGFSQGIIEYFDCFSNILKSILAWFETIIKSADDVTEAGKETFEEIRSAYLALMDIASTIPFVDSRLEDLLQEQKELEDKYKFNKRELDAIKENTSMSLQGVANSFLQYLLDTDVGEITQFEQLIPLWFEFLKSNPSTVELLKRWGKDKANLQSSVKNYENKQLPKIRKQVIDEIAYSTASKESYAADYIAETKRFPPTSFMPNGYGGVHKRKNIFGNKNLIAGTGSGGNDVGDYNWYDFLYSEIGVDAKNDFIRRKPYFENNSNSWVNSFRNHKSHKAISKLIAATEEIIRIIKDHTNKLTSSINGLNVFMGDTLKTEINIAGRILQVVHLIRFGKVLVGIIKAIGNGFSCESLKTNKNIVENVLEKEGGLGILELPAIISEGKDPENFIGISAYDGRYTSFINLNECGTYEKAFDINENNLDSVYESIKNVYIK